MEIQGLSRDRVKIRSIVDMSRNTYDLMKLFSGIKADVGHVEGSFQTFTCLPADIAHFAERRD